MQKGGGNMKKLLCVFFVFVIITSLASCGVVSNHMTTGYLQISEINGSTYMVSRFSKIYNIDLEYKTFSLVKNPDFDETFFDNKNEFKYEFFAGKYSAKIPDGYDNVVNHLKKYIPENEASVIDACGYANEGILIGFIQVYNDTSGIHGNYAIEKISHSIAFTYNVDTDEFSVIKKIGSIVIVAFSGSTVIYWKDKAYYSYNLTTGEEKHLVEDKAYDSGLNQTSTPAVFSNEKICVLHLVKGKTNKNIEYMYVFNFETNEFFELEHLK